MPTVSPPRRSNLPALTTVKITTNIDEFAMRQRRNRRGERVPTMSGAVRHLVRILPGFIWCCFSLMLGICKGINKCKSWRI